MKLFLIYVRDENYYNILPEKLRKKVNNGRIEIMAFPPLGIQTLALVVRQRGHQVILFDTCHPEMQEEQIEKAVKEQDPGVIALSYLSTTSYLVIKSMAARLRKAAPDTLIIIGGPNATVNHDKILEEADYITCACWREGEELLPDYLDNIDNPGNVEGLTWRSNGKVIVNPDRPLLDDLDKYPYSDRKSLPIECIESMPLDVPAVPSLDRFCTMQTTRECPFRCIYCDIPNLRQGKWNHITYR